jgi:hypothetical protein
LPPGITRFFLIRPNRPDWVGGDVDVAERSRRLIVA